MVVATGNAWSRELRELDERAQDWLRANAPDLASEASGVSVMFAHLSQRNINSMLGGTIFAMALISFILIFVFRSVRIGLISLLPNFIPALMSFGLWGYFVGHVGIASSVVVAVVFGIGRGRHHSFPERLPESAARRAWRAGGRAPPRSVRWAMRCSRRPPSSRPVFWFFASSGFEVSWALGILVTMTIILALAADFLLLPTLLLAIDRKTS